MTFQVMQCLREPPPRTSSRVADIGAVSEDAVVIRPGSKPGDPNVITVSCKDELGLACELSRSIFEFGLEVVRADLSIDGKWCWVIFWVTPRQGSSKSINWALLKKRLVSACPSSLSLLMPYKVKSEEKKKSYLLQICSADRAGLINDLAQTLWELEVDICKVNALTSPDGRAVDVFYLSDSRNFSPLKQREDYLRTQIKYVLGANQSLCELSVIANHEFQESLDFGMFPTIPNELFKDVSDSAGGACSSMDPEFSAIIDNSLSPGHTLLQMTFSDRKGVLYDCMRVLRDLNLQIAYGRLSSSSTKGTSDIDLFVVQANGNKLLDIDKQKCLLSRLQTDLCDPVRVMIENRGPDTELLVATTVEKNGRGRPRILYDVTLVLKMLDICIFKADSEKITHGDRMWEVYRFLLLERPNASFKSTRMRNQIVERVKSVVMGRQTRRGQ